MQRPGLGLLLHLPASGVELVMGCGEPLALQWGQP